MSRKPESKNKIENGKMKIGKTFVLAMTCITMQTAGARTQEWFAEHLPEARAKQAQCLERLKKDERLTQDEMAECQRASGAVFHSAKFTPSPPKSY